MSIEALVKNNDLNVKGLEAPKIKERSFDLDLSNDFPNLDIKVGGLVEEYLKELENNSESNFHTTFFMEKALAAKLLNPVRYSDLISPEICQKIEMLEDTFMPDMPEDEDAFDYLMQTGEGDIIEYYFLIRLLGLPGTFKKQKDILRDFFIEDYLKSGLDQNLDNQAENLAKYKVLFPDKFNKLNPDFISNLLKKSIEGWRDEGIDSDEFLSEVTYAFLVNPVLVKEIISIEDFNSLKNFAKKQNNLIRFGKLAIISSEKAEITDINGLILIPHISVNEVEIFPFPTVRSF